MPFLSRETGQKFKKVLLELQKKKIDDTTAAQRLLELDPHTALAYLLLGNLATEEGDLEKAESFLWKGLAEAPLQYLVYLPLADVRRSRDAADPMAPVLRRLA